MANKSLTDMQRKALIYAAAFLDVAAGEGIGVRVDLRNGGHENIFADDVVTALAAAFGLELEDRRLAFRDALTTTLKGL